MSSPTAMPTMRERRRGFWLREEQLNRHMKQPLFLLLALVLSVSSYGQRRQNPKMDFAAYFTLKAEQPAGVPVLMVYPRVVHQLANPLDQTGRFIKQNHRRFEYLLQN